MRKSKPLLIVSFLLLSACATKQVPMKNVTMRSVQKFRVGLMELTSHEFNAVDMYDCMKGFPSSGIALDGQVRQELENEGWFTDNMIASLQKQDFETYSNIKNYSLLMLLFKNKEQKSFIRLVNFLSKQVTTLSISAEQFTCENVFTAAKILVVDSIPPFADVYINERKIGEAPIWTSLADGTYEIQCKLPEDTFPKKIFQIPGTVKYLCKRENQSIKSIEGSGDQDSEYGEESGSWFLYAVVGLLSVGGAILPFLIF